MTTATLPKRSGLFRGIETARAAADANYVRPGKYLCRVVQTKIGQNRSNESFVAIEMVIEQVLMAADGGVSHKVGENVTHLVPCFGKGKDMFLPTMKAFAMGITGLTEGEITADDLDEQICEGGFNGTQVIVNARNIKTKSEKDFTRLSYSKPGEPEPEGDGQGEGTQE